MANTLVQFVADEGQVLTAKLAAVPGATGSPAASYACTETSPGLYSFTASEALVGEFDLWALDDDGFLALRQFVNLKNDTATHRCYDYTDGASAIAALDEIKAKTDLIRRGNINAKTSQCGTTLTWYENEEDAFALETDNDYSGSTLKVVIDREDGSVAAEIEDTDLTKTATAVTFTKPLAVTASTGEFKWSLRDTSGNANLMSGVINVIQTPG